MTKKNIKLNDLVNTGSFLPGLRVGLEKYEIEKLLGKSLGKADIETPDLDWFYVELKSGLELSILFDKEGICFKIDLDVDENEKNDLIIQFDQQLEIINESTP